jgi:hypothetical protein
MGVLLIVTIIPLLLFITVMLSSLWDGLSIGVVLGVSVIITVTMMLFFGLLKLESVDEQEIEGD